MSIDNQKIESFCLLGGDWAMPCTLHQLGVMVEAASSSWVDTVNVFGAQQITMTPAYPLLSVLYEVAQGVGLKFAYLSFVCFFISFALLGIFLLLHHYEVSFLGKIVGATAYLSGAIFFNYFLMGWIYILITFSIIPLVVWAYAQGLNGSRPWLIFSGLLCAFFCVQTTGMVWIIFILSTLTLVYCIQMRRLKYGLGCLLIVVSVFIVCNLYWLPSIFLYPPEMFTSGKTVTSEISNAMSSHYNSANALAGWGALFNFQFETIQREAGLIGTSFVYCMLALVGLMFATQPHRLAYGLCLMTPVFLFFILRNRELIEAIPYGNAFRDIARFSIISIFGMAVLAGLGSEIIWRHFQSHSNQRRITIISVFFMVLAGTTFPWWSGGMSKLENKGGPDIRMRLADIPSPFLELEQILSKEKYLGKAVFYPAGGTVSWVDDARFRGAYQETQDVFASWSNMPGHTYISDKSNGAASDVLNEVVLGTPTASSLDYLCRLGVRLFIFRNRLISNIESPSTELINEMLISGRWRPWFSTNDITVYAANEFSPRIYLKEPAPSVGNTFHPIVEYRKVKGSRYVIRIHGARAPFELYLAQAFSPYWDLFPLKVSPELSSKSVNLSLIPSGELSASKDELDFFLKKGWISFSEMGSDSPKAEPSENKGIISKLIMRSIQNDYLPVPSLWHRYSPAMSLNNSSQHASVNGAENVWTIDPAIACEGSDFCRREEDGSWEVNLLIQFIPQDVLYFGGLLSVGCYFILIIYLVYSSSGMLRQAKRSLLR